MKKHDYCELSHNYDIKNRYNPIFTPKYAQHGHTINECVCTGILSIGYQMEDYLTYKLTKRLFDLVFAFIFIILISPIALIVACLIKMTSPGPILFWSERYGTNGVLFNMPKFRSMHIDTPDVATHLLNDSENHLTKIGSLIRKYSIDEIPQLWSVLKGDMSFVGPRPALHNQQDLMQLRTCRNVHIVKPGITGLAQVKGRDELSLEAKALLDAEYLEKRSFSFDFKLILLTLLVIIEAKGVKH